MNSLQHDLARAIVHERLAEARQRHLAGAGRRARGEARRASGPVITVWWRQRLLGLRIGDRLRRRASGQPVGREGWSR